MKIPATALVFCFILYFSSFAALQAMEQGPETGPQPLSISVTLEQDGARGIIDPLSGSQEWFYSFLHEMREEPSLRYSDSSKIRADEDILAALKRYNGTDIIVLGQPCKLCHGGVGDTDTEGALRLPCGHGVHYNCIEEDIMRHDCAMCWICVVSANPADHLPCANGATPE